MVSGKANKAAMCSIVLPILFEPYDDQLCKCKNPSHYANLGIAFGDVVLVGTNGVNPYGMVA